MDILDKYILINSDTQVIKGDKIKYEVYGLGVSHGGVILERDVTKPSQLLFHVCNGLKEIEETMFREDYFFIKDVSKFHTHYRDCDDYVYSDNIIKLDKSAIGNIVKEYIYTCHPNLVEKTLLYWDRKKGVLHDTNVCSAHVKLDDNKEYLITKCLDKVTVKVYIDSNKDREKDNLEFVTDFLLDEKMYEKALEKSTLKYAIYKHFFGKVEESHLARYAELSNTLKDFVHIVKD